MSSVTIGFLVGGLTLVLLALRIHIGMAMLLGGAIGYIAVSGWDPLMSYFKHLAYGRFSVYDLSVVPLFLLMGNIASHGGLSRRLFEATNAFLGHYRGGVAMSAIGACAGFGAICGSSLATAATMGKVALPELRRNRYSPALATGALAAGGTLGILIPPSVVLVIYAILAEQNVAAMFMAALIPGLIAMLGYMLVVAIYARVVPDAGPASTRKSWAERMTAVARVWPIVTVFVVVIGGIYGGIFTPTEAAAVGTIATAALAVASRELDLKGLAHAVFGAAESTAMIFLILLGADVLNAFLALSQMPQALAGWVLESGLTPAAVLIGIILIYLVLGCVMDSLSMILLTIPIFLPIVMGLDFWGLNPTDKAIWFGILALMVVEIGLITPPVGMNVFIINSLARDIPMRETFRGVLPFLASDGVRIILLALFPGLSLWLVHLLGG
ncbi:TRAP transporter large permease [Thauera mechernichensis]|uniref:TRAP transporter large permease protein n=1 Tax=Thauera mechernichensis TaxID=82788 RepID=A0ABW3WET5_9RHOO|nr:MULTISPECIES: TRAP transporter large permease [Thauera]ENO81511.1 TRAP-type C4 dicarboxylate transport system large permease [Thauera sp. 27]ENO91958.1 TRAP-type C4 dicarboxylate transport system large permease [Thauera sp. 28]MDG3066301.1 TRAP transporter large permease [Thauera mechernichensis]WBL64986.1 TRAP transporter large permease [Thauera sp. WB-2]HAY10983.1 TRAP transporter large permease [Thauera sp.]